MRRCPDHGGGAAALDRTLGELCDDIAYRRGRLRCEGTVSRHEVADVHTRIGRIRTRAQSVGGGGIAAAEGQHVALPAGTILRVRLDTPLIVPQPARRGSRA